MKRLYTFIILFISIVSFVHAQSFKASAPEQVEEGENFRVQYVVTDSEPSSFKGPKFDSEGFELLAGPYTSTYSSYQMVNGKTTSSSSTTYTYTLCASKKGTYTIPSATVSAGGKTLTSNSLTINVIAIQEIHQEEVIAHSRIMIIHKMQDQLFRQKTYMLQLLQVKLMFMSKKLFF